MRSQRTLIVILALASLLFAASLCSAASTEKLSGSIIGFVSNRAGIPQMGATVLLYDGYNRPLDQALTNERGSFGFDALLPGVYSLRVSLASFVPALKKDIRIQPGMRSFLSINLASILSSIELLYSAPGESAIMNDDWKWVLRTASATRPVLRIAPGVDTSNPGQPKTSTAVFSETRGLVRVSTGEEGLLAAAGSQADLGTSFALATSLFGDNHLQFAGSVGYASSAGLPTAGFRTSYSRKDPWGVMPEVNVTMRQVLLPFRVGTSIAASQGDGAPALRTMSVSTLDQRTIGDKLLVEFGASMESIAFLERLNYLSPYARLTYDAGLLGEIQFAYNSGLPPIELLAAVSESEMDLRQDLRVLALFPRTSLRSGDAYVQRTRNFEIRHRKDFGSRSLVVSAYRESVRDAATVLSAPVDFYSSTDLMPDLSSNSSIFNLGNYNRLGLMASLTQKVGEELKLSMSYGNTSALTVEQSSLFSNDPDELRSMMLSSRRNWMAARIAGLSPWTGTWFTAAYRWTDYSVFLPTHLYLTQGMQPEIGLNLQIRQPLPSFGVWTGRLEASAELRNLLAQGYLPVSTPDGRELYLIQNPRAVRGGLSFIF